jgi:predicted PurR-regulated permease PerM
MFKNIVVKVAHLLFAIIKLVLSIIITVAIGVCVAVITHLILNRLNKQ